MGGWRLRFGKIVSTVSIKTGCVLLVNRATLGAFTAALKEPQRRSDERKTNWRHEGMGVNITLCVWPVVEKPIAAID